HLAGLHQPPDIAERHSGAGGSGRQDPYRGVRGQPGGDQLGGDAGPPPRHHAVPLAAGVAAADRGRRADRRGGGLRSGARGAAVLREQPDLRGGLAGADRAAPDSDREQDVGMTMLSLDNKVVVISGVGPALGTTLARRCAAAGADLVLAARTAERLEEVAGQITATGRRAVA